MQAFQRLSIKAKLIWIIMGTCSVALLVTCVLFMLFDLLTYRQKIARDIATLSEIIGDYSTATLEFDDPKTATEILTALRAEPTIVFACLYTTNGTVLASYRSSSELQAFTPPPVEVDGYQFQNDHLRLFRTIILPEDHHPIGTVFIRANLSALYHRLTRYAEIGAGVMLVSIIIALFLSSRLQRIISLPILGLANTTRRVSEEKNYAIRAKRDTEDEIGVLIDGFNGMLAQIQERDNALRSAHHDLEHRVTERTRELQQGIQERNHAEQLLRQQFARIHLLYQITRAIAERQDLPSIFAVVLQHLEQHLPIEFGAVYLLNTLEDQLLPAAHTPAGRSGEGALGCGPHGPIPLKQTLFSESLPRHLLYQAQSPDSRPPARPLAPANGSVVYAPFKVEGKTFGLLVVARQARQAFSSGECEFLRMLSEHVALAVHQTRLHTELKEAYDQVRATQQAVLQQERLRALGQMASGIAHDINNALSPVIGFADLLLLSETNLSAQSRKYLGQIKTAGMDIVHTVERLREFYRRRQDNESLQEIDLNPLVQQVVDLTRPRWRDIPQERGVVIEMKTNLAPALPPLLGIESEIRQAVINLVLNAIDAMPAGGTVLLATRWRQETDSADGIELEVVDTGTGMSEETRKRCLEPFFSTKGKRGTGLGLAMVYGVMDRHEGRIEIETASGQGTVMRLLFPVRRARVVSVIAEPMAEVTLPALRILCIDDEPQVLDVLGCLLEQVGHRVETATSGKAGIEAFKRARLQRQPFDAVITDLGMPNLDGRQVAEMLKRDCPQIPVLMLTGWGTFLQPAEGESLQVDEILSKPPTIKDLQAGLSRALQKAKTFASLVG